MKDILDLCRLNLMEEHIADSPAPDKEATLQAIDFAKRQIIIRIQAAEFVPEAIEHEK